MRDDQLYRMHEANAKRDMLLLRQFEFLMTKVQAYEEIFSSTSMRIKAIFFPVWARRVVDNRQRELLALRDKMMREAENRPVIKPVHLAGVPRG